MRCALFGKLASKRDFVAVQAPRRFLDVWEPWIQSSMSASRQELGNAWQAAYLKAPIWRFWLGEDLCGTTTMGAFMPSVDGIGRYFPLTAIASAEEGEAIPPPETDPQADWFAATEDFLLSTLDHRVTYEAIADGLVRLALPFAEQPSGTEDLVALPEGMIAFVASERSFADAFASMRRASPAKVCSSSTFWWTIGGEGFKPAALSARGMPDPFLFTEMLTGRFAFGLDNSPASV